MDLGETASPGFGRTPEPPKGVFRPLEFALFFLFWACKVGAQEHSPEVRRFCWLRHLVYLKLAFLSPGFEHDDWRYLPDWVYEQVHTHSEKSTTFTCQVSRYMQVSKYILFIQQLSQKLVTKCFTIARTNKIAGDTKRENKPKRCNIIKE